MIKHFLNKFWKSDLETIKTAYSNRQSVCWVCEFKIHTKNTIFKLNTQNTWVEKIERNNNQTNKQIATENIIVKSAQLNCIENNMFCIQVVCFIGEEAIFPSINSKR